MGQAELGGHSVRPADPADRGGLGWRGDLGRPRVGHTQGMAPVSVAGVDHQRGPQADRDHVHAPGHGDAAARLCGRDHDAVATGAGFPVRGLPAARALRPDLLGPRHAYDLLRRNALRDRADELRHAAAAWHPRCRLPDPELGQPLAHRDRRAARQHFTGRRRVRTHRLAAISPAVGVDLLARRRRRLLSLGAPDLRCRDIADRRQLRHDGAEDSCTGHDLHAHADVLLDDSRRKLTDRRRLPHPHGDVGDVVARPLPGLSLLQQ